MVVSGGEEMTYSELVRKLKKAGCYLIEHGTRHDEWYSPITKITFQVPRHKSQDIPKGTEMNIKKDAGLK